nr:ribonuclease H-like domain-containing protein [Tanacetum cinerariifolium]
MAIPEDHLEKFHKITDAKEMWDAIKSRFGGNDESKKMQKYILKQQFEGFSVSNSEGLHKGYDRSLPSSWSQVPLIMRTKPGVDTLSFDDLYNNLRVFESDVKGSTVSSSSIQNVAFVSSDNTNITNEVSTAYGVSTSSGHNSQKEGYSSYTDDLMYSFFANQSSGPQLDHEGLKQVDQFDLEEMDLKWYVAMISTRLKKFYKKTQRKLHFDAKEPVGFDKTKVECFSCHNTGHFARECRLKENQESRKRDTRNNRYKARDNWRRPVKQDEHKAMVTIDREGVDWTGHAEDDTENYALMAFNYNNSGSDTEMSAKDKSGLEYRNQIHEGVLSYENEVLESVFDSRSSDVKDIHVNDRFAKVEGMHAVPPLITGIYMPLKSDFRIDESKFTYGLKQSKTSESKNNNLDSCESNSSVETLEYVPKPVESKPKAVSKPKVWSATPIIEEYESDNDDEYVFKAPVEQEKPSCAFIVKHVKTPRQTVKDQDTCSQNPKVPKRDWAAILTKTGRFPVNAARQKISSQAASTKTVRKVNTARPIVNAIRPRNNVYKSHSPIRRPFNRKTAPKANFANHKVNTVRDKQLMLLEAIGKLLLRPQQTSKRKGIADSGCSRHISGNKAYLIEYQDFNGGLIAFGGTQDNINVGNSDMEAERVQEYFVLPLWSSYTSTVKSSEAKNGDEKLIGDTAKTLRKTFAKSTEDLLLQAGAARANSTNNVNTNSTPVNTASTPVNSASLSRNVIAARPSYPDLSTYVNQDDSQIPSLEDIYEVPNDGIFTSASYDDEGAVADYINLESIMNIEPKKISQALEDKSWVDSMQEELLQFKTYQVWILVDLPFGKKVTPKTSHLQAMKRIFRYLKGQSKLGLWSLRESVFNLEAYSDRDYAGANLDRKSTTAGPVSPKTRSLGKEYVSKQGRKKDKTEQILKKYCQYTSSISTAEITLFLLGVKRRKEASTPIDADKPLLKDSDGEDVDVHTYSKITTLVEHIIVTGDENRPPMLEKSMYDSWISCIRLFIKGKKMQGNDSIDCINKAMTFLSVVASRNKGIATTSKGNYTTGQAKEKLMLAEAQEAGQILDEEQLAFIADPGITEVQVSQPKAVLMVNLLSYDTDVLSKVPCSDTYPNDMINQYVQEMPYSEQTHIVDFLDKEITSDINIIPYSQYLQES